MSRTGTEFGRYTQMSGVTGEIHEPTEAELARVRKKTEPYTFPTSISEVVSRLPAQQIPGK